MCVCDLNLKILKKIVLYFNNTNFFISSKGRAPKILIRKKKNLVKKIGGPLKNLLINDKSRDFLPLFEIFD